MTDHPTTAARGLYEAIIRDPSCDLVRLAYADELDAAGECKRASEIRYGGIMTASRASHCEPREKWWDGEPFMIEEIIQSLILTPGVSSVTVRRGFVDSVAMTMQAFVGGGECRNCGGAGDVLHPTHYRQPCKECGDGKTNGTGRVPGLASVICARWPVMSVTFSDKQPFPYGRDPEIDRWGWFRLVSEDDESTIPNELWSRMTGHHVYGGIPHAIKWFNTRESAQLALSHAAVAYARELAGLPALKHANSTQPVAV